MNALLIVNDYMHVAVWYVNLSRHEPAIDLNL